MADLSTTRIRTNDLPPTVAITDGGVDKLLIIIDGKNKLISLGDFFANIKSDVVINPGFGSIDVTINGQSKANLFKVDSVNDKIGIGTATPTELLHVQGNVAIGGTGSGQNGTLTLSNEVLVVGDTSAPISINNSFTISNISTTASSSSTSTLTLDAPTKVNQIKMLVISDTHVDKSSNLNYNVTITNVLGTQSAKLTKAGDSISLLSVDHNGGFKWIVTAYNGATVT